MTPDSSQPIDIEKEAEEIMVHLCGKGHTMFHTKNLIEGFGRLVAVRVEEDTIERCAKECKSIQGIINDGCDFVCSADEAIKCIDRLYAPAALGKGETK